MMDDFEVADAGSFSSMISTRDGKNLSRKGILTGVCRATDLVALSRCTLFSIQDGPSDGTVEAVLTKKTLCVNF